MLGAEQADCCNRSFSTVRLAISDEVCKSGQSPPSCQEHLLRIMQWSATTTQQANIPLCMMVHTWLVLLRIGNREQLKSAKP